MHPTPDTSHLTTDILANVYEPSEDSFLFMDALEKDIAELTSTPRRLCVEIGSGSGCVSTFLATLLPPHSAFFLCTDINPHATLATCRTFKQNHVHTYMDALRMDFITTHRRGCIDVLLFNPPYVVTPSQEVGSHGIEAAWAGGVDGREVIDRFLFDSEVPERLLSLDGVFYLVVVQENRPQEIMQRMYDRFGMHAKVILTRKAGREVLSVLRFQRRHVALNLRAF